MADPPLSCVLNPCRLDKVRESVKRRLHRTSVRVFAGAQADNLLVHFLGDVNVPTEKGRGA